ncbi:MAG: LexA family transcriptional regulator [Geobacter sp.]|nr:MAG: LexA family transcriptional regulator [Geobacter sp.]
MADLTLRQRQTLEIITSYIENNGYPPSLREIAASLNIAGTRGVLGHLEALERKGYLKKDAGSSRGIALTSSFSQSVALPIAGTVRAGQLHGAIEDIQGYFAVDKALVKGEGCFCLRVKGDSMIGAGIFNGDLALVRPQPAAENRDTVVAMVDGEATLKWFFREKDHIRLQPANPNMAPIIVGPEREVSIIGKVIGIYRQME